MIAGLHFVESLVMRLGAAIIVIIGLCMAALVLFERRLAGDIGHIDELLIQASKGRNVSADLETLQQNLRAMWIWRIAIWLMDFVGVVLLGLLFVKVSQRRIRSDLPRALPDDDYALIRRLAGRISRFQFGVITLLALALAVALVCSTIAYLVRQCGRAGDFLDTLLRYVIPC